MGRNNLAFFAIQTAFSRQLIKYPWQLTLALLGVSIGIAVIVAIQLVRVSAYESFEQATLINSDYASHQISPRRGHTLPFALFAQLKRQHPHISMSPVLQFPAIVRADNNIPGKQITILGVEAISQASRGLSTDHPSRSQSTAVDIQELIRDPQFAAVNEWTSTALALETDVQVSLEMGDRLSDIIIRAILPNQDLPGGMTNNTMLVDIATAQRILGDYEVISRIDLDIDDHTLALLKTALPTEAVVTDILQQTERLRRMTGAFYTNLTALSLMALMMGVFLIYNTETFLVLQRQQMIARLKALGVTNRAIFKAILAESALLGFIGSVIGVLIGYFLAQNLLKYVSLTLNDLYFKNETSSIIIDPLLTAGVIMLGVLVTVCAGCLPAHSAATTPLVQTLHKMNSHQRKLKFHYRWYLLFALLSFIICIASLGLNKDIKGGFFAIACVLLGFSSLCAPLLHLLASRRTNNFSTGRVDENKLGGMLFTRIGIRTIGMSLGRSSTAAAALMIATAAGIGIGVMVASFRVSVADWLSSSLRADFYISKSFSLDSSVSEHISEPAKKLIEEISGVNDLSSVLRAKTKMVNHAQRWEVRLSAFELNDAAKSGFDFLERENGVWQRWQTDNVVLITEPFAYHNELEFGDEITLVTDNGEQKFTIIGIYKDYASEQGGISLNRATFDRHWQVTGYSGLGLYTNERLTLKAVSDYLHKHHRLQGLSVVSSADLLAQSLEVFDRTFLITNLLKLITIAVAFVGIVGALLAQQLERSQEYGIYRALGLTRGEVLRIVLTQTISIGLVAAIVAIPAGLSVAWILIEIINPRSFGWTMTSVVPASSVASSLLIAITAALIAGVIPALRISKLPPAEALRYE